LISFIPRRHGEVAEAIAAGDPPAAADAPSGRGGERRRRARGASWSRGAGGLPLGGRSA